MFFFMKNLRNEERERTNKKEFYEKHMTEIRCILEICPVGGGLNIFFQGGLAPVSAWNPPGKPYIYWSRARGWAQPCPLYSLYTTLNEIKRLEKAWEISKGGKKLTRTEKEVWEATKKKFKKNLNVQLCKKKGLWKKNLNKIFESKSERKTFIYKVAISVWLFVCHIIIHKRLDRFASNFDWGTRENHGNELS